MFTAAFVTADAPQPLMLELQTELATYGWTQAELAGFLDSAEPLDWGGAEKADPKLLAWALELGISEQALASQERAQLALALAVHTAQLARLGYSRREVATAAAGAARAALQEMTRLRSENSDQASGQMVRKRLVTAMEQQSRQAHRVRTGEPAGNTYRIGEAEPGVPLRPEEPPTPGDGGPADDTSGPGAPYGPGN